MNYNIIIVTIIIIIVIVAVPTHTHTHLVLSCCSFKSVGMLLSDLSDFDAEFI